LLMKRDSQGGGEKEVLNPDRGGVSSRRDATIMVAKANKEKEGGAGTGGRLSRPYLGEAVRTMPTEKQTLGAERPRKRMQIAKQLKQKETI